MARAVQHLQRHIPHIDHIAFIEPAIRTQRLAILQPNIRLCAGNPSSQNSSSFSGPNNRYAIMLRQFSRGANVIEVAMRQQDLHQRDASLRHHRFDTFSIAADRPAPPAGFARTR